MVNISREQVIYGKIITLVECCCATWSLLSKWLVMEACNKEQGKSEIMYGACWGHHGMTFGTNFESLFVFILLFNMLFVKNIFHLIIKKNLHLICYWTELMLFKGVLIILQGFSLGCNLGHVMHTNVVHGF